MITYHDTGEVKDINRYTNMFSVMCNNVNRNRCYISFADQQGHEISLTMESGIRVIDVFPVHSIRELEKQYAIAVGTCVDNARYYVVCRNSPCFACFPGQVIVETDRNELVVAPFVDEEILKESVFDENINADKIFFWNMIEPNFDIIKSNMIRHGVLGKGEGILGFGRIRSN